MFSELGYYFERPDLDALVDRLVAALEPGGELVACHWRGTSPDHRLHGDTVHEALDAHPALRRRHHEVHDRYRLDGYTVSAGVSAGGRQ